MATTRRAGESVGDDMLAAPLAPLLVGAGNSARRAIDRIAQLRFRFVQFTATEAGLRPRDLDQSARRDLLATLRRAELSVCGLDAWIPSQHFLDPARVDRAVSAAGDAIKLAADLGRCPVSIVLPAPPTDPPTKSTATPPTKSTAEPVDLHAVLEALAGQADRLGVEVADHAVPVASTRASVIGVGIDPAAWLSRSLDSAQAVMAHGERLICARLCDLTRSGLRAAVGDAHEGRLDLQAYKIALSVSGYRRPIVIDARQWSDPEAGLLQTRAAWQSVT